MGFDRLPVVRAEESSSGKFMGRQGTDLPVPMISIGIRADAHLEMIAGLQPLRPQGLKAVEEDLALRHD
jgi:hypothetical protein